jgi:hypothetical protein
MKDDPGNVVRFRPRPKRPPPPSKPKTQPYRPTGGGGERAINWSRAPKAIVAVLIFFLAMWLLGRLVDWISKIGIG